MMIYTNPKTGQTIESKLDNFTALERCRAKDSDFAQSLVHANDRRGSLSQSQWFWVHKLANEVSQQTLFTTSELPEAVDIPKRQAPQFVSEIGIYIVDGVVYKVLLSRESGRFYARRLMKHGNWVYEAGAMSRIKPEHKASLEQAQEYGRLTGYCAVCGRLLTAPESIERGIGPICAEKF